MVMDNARFGKPLVTLRSQFSNVSVRPCCGSGAVVVRCQTRSPIQPCPELVTSIVGERDWFIVHAHRGFGGSGKRAIEPESVSVSA